jgi:AcrR family transcriptional regulator
MKDTREFIIDEAFKLFLNRSYEAVSISVISEAIGFTKGALYHHFTNKEELFHAVIDKHLPIPRIVVDEVNMTLADYTNVCISYVEKILNNIFGNGQIFSPINYLSLIADSFRHYESYGNQKLEHLREDIGKAETIIRNAILRGEIRSDINVRAVAAQYFSITIGMAGDILMNSSETSAIRSLREQLEELYKLLKK